MRPAPTVTVLIPSYNYARFLEECVESVWNQTWRPLEVIIADDESRDDSVKIAHELARRAPIRTEVLALPHGGIVATLNAALRLATGEFIAILAADDRYRPNKIEVQIAEMLASPDIVLSHCNFVQIDSSGRRIDEHPTVARPPASGHVLRDLLLGRVAMKTGPLVRRDFLDAIGGFDTRYIVEDWPLYLKAASRGRIAYVGEPLVERRVHGTNWSARINPDRTLPDLYRDGAIDLIRELASSREEYEEAASIHLSIQLRVAMYAGQWGWAFKMAHQLSEALPSRRAYFAKQMGLGALSFAWSRTGRRYLPASVQTRIVGLARSRGLT